MTTPTTAMERLAAVGPTGTEWYLTDAIGSVRLTLDDAGQPLGGHDLAYTPFGIPQSGAQPALFGFAGEQWDADTGLVYLRARWYDPASGTFLSRDPFAGYPTIPYSQHPYQYGYSNPALYTDPSGMLAIFVHGSFGQTDPQIRIPMYALADEFVRRGFIEPQEELIKTGPEDFPGWDSQPRIQEYAEKIVAAHCKGEKVTIAGNSRGAVFLQRVLDEAMIASLRQGILPTSDMVDLFVSIAPIHSPGTPQSIMPYNQKRTIVDRHYNVLSEYGWASPADWRFHADRATAANYLLLNWAVAEIRQSLNDVQNVIMPELYIHDAENKVYPDSFHNGLIGEFQVMPIVVPFLGLPERYQQELFDLFFSVPGASIPPYHIISDRHNQVIEDILLIGAGIQ
ncbi:RHS repeat-associated core domain-containing protein [bacterium]|nr:RHS repeat-associated core domain-containing protein [bacterium]